MTAAGVTEEDPQGAWAWGECSGKQWHLVQPSLQHTLLPRADSTRAREANYST